MTDGLDSPLATRNLRGGLAFLRRWHSARNINHPLRAAERADAQAWLRARQPVPPVETGPRTDPYPKKRIKRATPTPDSDGKYRL